MRSVALISPGRDMGQAVGALLVRGVDGTVDAPARATEKVPTK